MSQVNVVHLCNRHCAVFFASLGHAIEERIVCEEVWEGDNGVLAGFLSPMFGPEMRSLAPCAVCIAQDSRSHAVSSFRLSSSSRDGLFDENLCAHVAGDTLVMTILNKNEVAGLEGFWQLYLVPCTLLVSCS